jgi:hypothetical protein
MTAVDFLEIGPPARQPKESWAEYKIRRRVENKKLKHYFQHCVKLWDSSKKGQYIKDRDGPLARPQALVDRADDRPQGAPGHVTP